jgi:hypothetical protein
MKLLSGRYLLLAYLGSMELFALPSREPVTSTIKTTVDGQCPRIWFYHDKLGKFIDPVIFSSADINNPTVDSPFSIWSDERIYEVTITLSDATDVQARVISRTIDTDLGITRIGPSWMGIGTESAVFPRRGRRLYMFAPAARASHSRGLIRLARDNLPVTEGTDLGPPLSPESDEIAGVSMDEESGTLFLFLRNKDLPHTGHHYIRIVRMT